MEKIKLEFDPKKEILFLVGVDSKTIKQPLFAALVRGFKGKLLPNSSIAIETKQEELASRYQSLKKLLNRLGKEIEAEGHVTTSLAQIEKEENNFLEFSRKAHDIWHSQIDTNDFRTFADVVKKICSERILYRKQLLSAFHLAFAQNACNFSVPGAGKTSIVYAAYAFLKHLSNDDDKHVDRLLIVGPLSSFKAWEDEYEDIFGRKANSRRISGGMPIEIRRDHLRGISYESRDVEITLTSYQTLAFSEEDFRIFLERSDQRTMMVLDEAHYIKNEDGIWAAAALRLAPLASARIVLTGTPAPNGYEDLVNLFKFIYPNKQIINFPTSSLRAMSDGAMSRAIPELKSKIQPFYTRIRKVDLNLPNANEIRVPVPMHETQERIYRNLERRIIPQLGQSLDSPNGALRVKARLIRLRQASVNPLLLLRPLDEEGIFDTNSTGDFSIGELEVSNLIRSFDENNLVRLSICRQLVLQILQEQGKVLIWSYFLGNLERLRAIFKNDAPFVELLTGITPVAGGDPDEESILGTREEIIKRFHQTNDKAVLIANPQAVGESISLHKACHSAIYFDRDFNAGRFIQSKDRIHRYNPSGGPTVSYYHLISPNTVDEDIDNRLILKEQRLNDLVDSSDIPLLTNIDDEFGDLTQIIRSYELRKSN